MEGRFFCVGISRISALTRYRAGGGGSAPVNTVAPVASGTFVPGQTASCTTGTWTSDAGTITYAYQWVRDGSPVSGATSSTYVLTSLDTAATTFLCRVTATNTAGSTQANSNNMAGELPP